MSEIRSGNCSICGEEFSLDEMKKVLTSSFNVCDCCMKMANPEDDYAEVKNVVYSYLRFSQKMDPELASPEIKIEPVDTYVQKAVDLLKKINPSYFIGVRKIVIDSGTGFGHVEVGGPQHGDPTVIHVNLAKIKSEIQTKLSGASKEQADDAIIKAIATTIAHEKGHITSFKPESGFQGGESPAESEESSIHKKIEDYYGKTL